MITEKTVFILGAGASCPYGFPSGAQLREKICSYPSRGFIGFLDATYSSRTEIRGILEHRIAEFTKTFFDSKISIDLFLALNPEFAEIGKYIIAFEILEAERNSNFAERAPIRDQDWYSCLFRGMFNPIRDKTQINKFSENNVSFITFNYDRSLEQCFYEGLRNSFTSVPEQEIITILKQLKIIHVYGSIAPLRWQDAKDGIEYKTPITGLILQKTSKNLRTIYEEKQNPELDEAKKLIAEAKRVFFLGFGYADENMEILGLPNIISHSSKVYGTAFGFETNEVNEVCRKIISGIVAKLPEKERTAISMGLGMRVKLENKDCLKLLRNYL